MPYVTTADVAQYLRDGKTVRSAIAGCVGQVGEVYDGMIYLKKDRGRYRGRQDAKGVFGLSKDYKIVAVTNTDDSITLWNESLAPQSKPKEYMFVVQETLTRHRHYYVQADTVDEAEEKIKDFSNVVRQATPSNELVDVRDFDVLETITDANGE